MACLRSFFWFLYGNARSKTAVVKEIELMGIRAKTSKVYPLWTSKVSHVWCHLYWIWNAPCRNFSATPQKCAQHVLQFPDLLYYSTWLVKLLFWLLVRERSWVIHVPWNIRSGDLKWHFTYYGISDSRISSDTPEYVPWNIRYWQVTYHGVSGTGLPLYLQYRGNSFKTNTGWQ